MDMTDPRGHLLVLKAIIVLRPRLAQRGRWRCARATTFRTEGTRARIATDPSADFVSFQTIKTIQPCAQGEEGNLNPTHGDSESLTRL